MNDEKQSLFPNARVTAEGYLTVPQGNVVWTIYVDLSGQIKQTGLSLVKAAKPKYDLANAATIRLSRPRVFQTADEVLIQDEQEGRAHVSIKESVDLPDEEAEQVSAREAALNSALQLGRTKASVSISGHRQKSSVTTGEWSFGKDWLIYCTSMQPSEDEKEAWRNSLPEEYTSITKIYRPTQFAQGLGFGMSEHIGVRGEAKPIRCSFDGFSATEEVRRGQIVLHGPMLYVDNPYQWISQAETRWERLFAMCFLKSRERDYVSQKEYRFVLLSIGDDVRDVFDLPVSGWLKDCLLPVRYPDVTLNEPSVLVENEESPTGKERIIERTYTYRRSRTRRERSGSKVNEIYSERSKEEMIEETVTSPEELLPLSPFEDEQKPDVIILHQMGTQLQFIHEAYRNEAINRWRVETVRMNPEIAVGPAIGTPPRELSIPPELRYDISNNYPADPRFILDLCLNPSRPRAPIHNRDLSKYSQDEIAHVLACGDTLQRAVDLLESNEQPQAVASAWYAQRFILDLVLSFGSIVRNVCIIRDGVAVVQLMQAQRTDAFASAAFSGTGTYLLHIDDGRVEDNMFPGEPSLKGQIGLSDYMDFLERYGWTRIRKA